MSKILLASGEYIEDVTFSSVATPTFLQAALHVGTPYTPVWLMRQAGRYLSQYRATREKAGSFMQLAKNPDLACEVTLQPLDMFNLDAAILFSDILTVPDAMGLGLSFEQGEGPKFAHPVRSEADVNRLRVAPMEKLRYVFDAVSTIRKALTQSDGRARVPLIGFSGSPWTLACYMVEGGGSQDFARVKNMLYTRPDLMHKLLNVVTDSVVDYLNLQIESGAQAVMIFDSWGGALADGAFQEFSLGFTQKVLMRLKRLDANGCTIARIVFTKGGGQWLGEQMALDCDCLGVDWTCSLANARQLIEQHSRSKPEAIKALQGNLDPQILLTTPDIVNREAVKVLESFGKPIPNQAMGATHLFNLGHGILQQTPPENVAALVQTVHHHSRLMRANS